MFFMYYHGNRNKPPGLLLEHFAGVSEVPSNRVEWYFSFIELTRTLFLVYSVSNFLNKQIHF
jgi:hypothetical protein